MGYRKADAILPPEVVALIQQYVDGEYIHLHSPQGRKKEELGRDDRMPQGNP